jgi:hypothetical protein
MKYMENEMSFKNQQKIFRSHFYIEFGAVHK